MKKSTRLYWAWGGAGLLAAVLAYNAWVAVPVMSALWEETDVKVLTYRHWLVDPSTIVFDVQTVGPEASMADVDRNLFRAAEALKDHQYKSVILAYKGRARYRLDGGHFHTIGEEWSYQNPMYVVRTLPEHIYTMDGLPAFSSYTGGWLGVMTKQLEQHNELHQRWYLLAMVKQDPDGPLLSAMDEIN